jgi:hypothetical protein
MKDRSIIRFAILAYWTCFWGLSVLDKIIPDVQQSWVGKDFFTLFVKFFESLGIKNPFLATLSLSAIATIEACIFVLFLFSFFYYLKGNIELSERWLNRALLFSVSLFTLFSLGDNAFGDRFQLLEHGLFWMALVASWIVFKFLTKEDESHLNFRPSSGLNLLLIIGIVLVSATTFSIFSFSKNAISKIGKPVEGVEIAQGIYKFDLPFLADRVALKNTVNGFKNEHPELKLNYIYTGPSELNSKMKTHVLVYFFTEKNKKVE